MITMTANNQSEQVYSKDSICISNDDLSGIAGSITDYFNESSHTGISVLSKALSAKNIENSEFVNKYHSVSEMVAFAASSVYSHIITKFFPKLVKLYKSDNDESEKNDFRIEILPGFFVSPLNCLFSLLKS